MAWNRKLYRVLGHRFLGFTTNRWSWRDMARMGRNTSMEGLQIGVGLGIGLFYSRIRANMVMDRVWYDHWDGGWWVCIRSGWMDQVMRKRCYDGKNGTQNEYLITE